MFIAVLDPHIPLLIVCLLVAVYMFAAIKFPALRFIFRLKRFAAGVVGMDEERNRAMAERLGAILCPLLGLGAVVAAGWLALDWKKSVASEEEGRVRLANEQRRKIGQIGEMLKSAEIKDVSFDSFGRLGLTDTGRKQAEDFVRTLAAHVESDLLPLPLQYAQLPRGGLRVTFKDDQRTGRQSYVEMIPERNQIGISTGNGEVVTAQIPDGLRSEWEQLGKLEKVDLEAVKRAEQKKKSEEASRLRAYEIKSLKTFEGEPGWKIYDAVAQAPKAEQEAIKSKFVGMRIDWECRLSSLTKTGARAQFNASQPRPGGGMSYSLRCEADAVALADAGDLKKDDFIRIRGVIQSIDKGILIQVDKIERFTP